MTTRRWGSLLLVAGGALLVVGAFVPWVRSGPCCMATAPHDSIVFDLDGGWILVVLGWLCMLGGVLHLWLDDSRPVIAILALVLAALATLFIVSATDPQGLGTENFNLLPGRFVPYVGLALTVVGSLMIVAAPRRHRSP